MSGGLSLKSMMVTVTVAVALALLESMATMVKLYSVRVSRSKSEESRTISLSSKLLKPKMSSMALFPVGLKASPIVRVGVSVGWTHKGKIIAKHEYYYSHTSIIYK